MAPDLVRRSLERLPASPPSDTPAADLARLGVARAAQLGLNEGVDGPFPAALEAMREALPRLNRYPARGSLALVEALAARHGVAVENVIVTAGADAAIGYACQAVLDPGDEVVVPWPSFPSFVRDPEKRDAVPVTVPLRGGAIDFDALLGAVTDRARVAFVATPNNPTGLASPRDALLGFVEQLPRHVLPVVDEAYFDYLDPSARLDAIAELVARGRNVLALRTFSKLYGLAGLRIGYAVGPVALVAAMRKVQRGYDVGALAQVAALASLGDEREVARRRAANARAVAVLADALAAAGFDVLAGSVANFVLVDVARDADVATARLLERGVAVQSGVPFGAPASLRVSAGTPEEIAHAVEQLRAVAAATTV